MLGSQAWREELLDHGAFERITQLTNKGGWVFEGVHPQYGVAFNVFRKNPSGTDVDMRIYGPYDTKAGYDKGVHGAGAIAPTKEVRSWTGSASIPLLKSEEAAGAFRTMRRHVRIGDLPFRYMTELHATNEKKHMLLDPASTSGLWPVWKGSSFDLWTPDTGEIYAWAAPDYITEYLQAKRQRQARNKRTGMYGMPPAWVNDPATLPIRHARIAFRDISRSTDSRTMRACLVPADKPLTNKAPYLLRQNGATIEDEAYLLGVLCTRVFDWQARCTVETNINKYVLDAFAVPWPDPGHRGHQRVIEIATRLAAQGPAYQPWAAALGHTPSPVGPADTADLLVELDALVARLYGLNVDELTHIYATFHPTGGHEAFGAKVIAHFKTLTFDPAEAAS